MKFWTEFKAFIRRGNVVDMAVGVIIGSAFGAIVTALTNKIIMPLINLLLSAGGANGLETAYTFLKTVYNADGSIDLTKSIYIDWGAFITAILNFFIIALVLFVILKVATKANKVFKGTVTDLTDKQIKQERAEVWKASKEQKKSFSKMWKAHCKEKEEKLKKEKEEAEKAKKEEAYRNSTEGLLKEIRDLLAENKQLKQEIAAQTEVKTEKSQNTALSSDDKATDEQK